MASAAVTARETVRSLLGQRSHLRPATDTVRHKVWPFSLARSETQLKGYRYDVHNDCRASRGSPFGGLALFPRPWARAETARYTEQTATLESIFRV